MHSICPSSNFSLSKLFNLLLFSTHLTVATSFPLFKLNMWKSSLSLLSSHPSSNLWGNSLGPDIKIYTEFNLSHHLLCGHLLPLSPTWTTDTSSKLLCRIPSFPFKSILKTGVREIHLKYKSNFAILLLITLYWPPISLKWLCCSLTLVPILNSYYSPSHSLHCKPTDLKYTRDVLNI